MSKSPKKVAARVGDLVHISLQPTLDLVRGGHAPGKDQLGKPDLASTAGSREAAGAVLSRAPWTIKVVAQERG